VTTPLPYARAFLWGDEASSNRMAAPKFLASAKGGFSKPGRPIPPSLVERLAAAYGVATREDNKKPQSAEWQFNTAQKRNVHEALLGRDRSQLARLLDDPGSNNLFFGFDNLFAEQTSALLSSRAIQDGRLLQMAHMLLVLAEAVGACKAWVPEFGSTYPAHDQGEALSVEDLISRIDLALGERIDFPNPYPNEHGLVTSRGICSHRAYHAVYQAWRLKTLAQTYGKRVLEIGAGQGRTAYYAARLGLSYTIVDLPLSNVAQASFLGVTLGEQAICLSGEPYRQGCIRITTPGRLAQMSEDFDVVLAADCLPEMTQEVATEYAAFTARRAKVLLSINHEAKDFVVRGLGPIAPYLVYRAPYWLRPGYVEEMFLGAR